MQATKRKEYSVTVIIFIFLTVLCIVGMVRITMIMLEGANRFESINLIDDVRYDANQNMTDTIVKVKNTIESYYSINIYYGSVLQKVASQINANVLYDEEAILRMLQDINAELTKYPSGILEEIQNAGYKVSIYLVDSFNNDDVALANRTSSGNFNIFLSNASDFEKAMHHEFYHILEYYIKLEFDINNTYGVWSTYNPQGFDYSNDVRNINRKICIWS